MKAKSVQHRSEIAFPIVLLHLRVHTVHTMWLPCYSAVYDYYLGFGNRRREVLFTMAYALKVLLKSHALELVSRREFREDT